MSLADTAKELKEQAASQELQELRKMRAYVAEHGKEFFDRKLEEFNAIEDSAEKYTEEGAKKQLRILAEMNRAHRTVKEYETVLKYAEMEQKNARKAGIENGGEIYMKKSRSILEKRMAEIDRKFREECRLQLQIGDAKEGEKDGYF